MLLEWANERGLSLEVYYLSFRFHLPPCLSAFCMSRGVEEVSLIIRWFPSGPGAYIHPFECRVRQL